MRTTSFFLLLFLLSFSARAQNEVDALRYSQTFFGGSARYMGLSGAMGAIGGDMSCAAVNPAGLARFTLAEFGGSLSYTLNSSSTLFGNKISNDSRGSFNVGNVGIVGAVPGGKNSDWKMIQFGFTYQKLSNFSNNFVVEGNNNSSLLDVFAIQSNGIDETQLIDQLPFTGGLAYWTYLIDPDTVTHSQYSTQIPGSQVHQIRTVNQKGSSGEMDFSLSGNYMDKWYFGGTVGVPIVRYGETYSHEEYTLDSSLALDSYKYDFNLTTRGTGVNLKVGTIFLPEPWIRIGLALHTSSLISLTDSWGSDIYSKFRNGDQYEQASVPGLYSYRLRTPGKAIGSLGFIIGKWGLISADVERIDYSKSLLKVRAFDSGSFSVENGTIKNTYQKATNLRFGTEWRYKKFMIRGGYAIYGSPFKKDMVISDNTRTSYSAGVGYRNKKAYVDLTWIKTVWSEDYYLYDPSLTNAALIDRSAVTLMLSAGVRF